MLRLRFPASNCDYDLSDLLVRLQEAVGVNDLVKPERLGDEWFERAIIQSVVDELLCLVQTRGIVCDFHHDVAANSEPLRQQLKQRERGRLGAQRTVEEDDSQAGRRLDQFLDGWAADRIEHHA